MISSFTILITATIIFTMFILALLLYQRWRTNDFSSIVRSFVIALLINIVLLVLVKKNESISGEDLTSFYLGSIIVIYTLLLKGVYYFYHRSSKKEQLVFNSMIGLLLVNVIVSKFIHYNISEIVTIAFSATILVYSYFSFKQKSVIFKASIIFIFLAMLLQTVGMKIIILHSGLIIFSIICILVLFYQRIVEIMAAASQSSALDGLTGIFNKKYFIKKVNEHLSRSAHCAIIFVDIDDFKKTNNTQGHHIGDQILKLVAKILSEECENNGFAARYGGEELVAFVIIDENNPPGTIAEAFRIRVENESKEIYPSTVSVGYSENKGHNISVHDFIKQADDSMYIAKKQGKNKVIRYEQ